MEITPQQIDAFYALDAAKTLVSRMEELDSEDANLMVNQLGDLSLKSVERITEAFAALSSKENYFVQVYFQQEILDTFENYGNHSWDEDDFLTPMSMVRHFAEFNDTSRAYFVHDCISAARRRASTLTFEPEQHAIVLQGAVVQGAITRSPRQAESIDEQSDKPTIMEQLTWFAQNTDALICVADVLRERTYGGVLDFDLCRNIVEGAATSGKALLEGAL